MDLLDMAMPQMGADYSQLANQMRPQMMPNAPSPMAGLMYGQDTVSHDRMLQKMAVLAAMDASMKAQKAEEFSAAAPGRMAEVRTKNRMAEGREGMANDRLKVEKDEMGAKGMEARRKKIHERLKAVEPYTNMWAGAQSPEDKQAILQLLQADSDATGGDPRLANMDLATAEKFFGAARQAQMQDPGYQKEVMKEEGRTKRAGMAIDSKEKLQQKEAQLKVMLKQLGITAVQSNQSAANQLMMRLANNGSLTEAERAAMDLALDIASYNAQVKGATAQPQVGVKGGQVTIQPPAVPARPQVPKVTPQPSSGTEDSDAGATPAVFKTPAGNGPPEDLPDVGSNYTFPQGSESTQPPIRGKVLKHVRRKVGDRTQWGVVVQTTTGSKIIVPFGE